MNYRPEDYRREQEQVAALEELLGFDFIPAFVVDEKTEKQLEGLEGFPLLNKKEELRKYSRIDCLCIEDLNQFRQRDFKAFFELKTSFEDTFRGKVRYIDLYKLKQLKKAVETYNKKCYLVYFSYDRKSEKMKNRLIGYSKKFGYFYRDYFIYIYDVDDLDLQQLEREEREEKMLLKLPQELSLSVQELKLELLK